ncbi:hypothetical protein [Celeribacter sp. ULVN23_4]
MRRACLNDAAVIFARSGPDAVYGDLDHVSANDTNKVIRHWGAGA